MAMMLVMFLLILEIRSLILLYWAVFLIGFCQAISIIQGFPYLMESLPMSKRNITATFTGMIDKVLLVISTLLLKYYVSNWVIIMLPALFTSLIAATLTFFLIDSPQFHHDKGSYTRSKHLFNQISLYNNFLPLELYSIKFENEHKAEEDLKALKHSKQKEATLSDIIKGNQNETGLQSFQQ